MGGQKRCLNAREGVNNSRFISKALGNFDEEAICPCNVVSVCALWAVDAYQDGAAFGA